MLKRIIRYKVYYDRSRQYWNYMKTLALIAALYKIFEDSGLGVWVLQNKLMVIPASILLYLVLSFIMGYLDKKFRIREYEIGEYNKTDPNIQKIHKDLNEIKNILNDNGADSKPPR